MIGPVRDAAATSADAVYATAVDAVSATSADAVGVRGRDAIATPVATSLRSWMTDGKGIARGDEGHFDKNIPLSLEFRNKRLSERASGQTNGRSGAREQCGPSGMSERCGRMSKRGSKWTSTRVDFIS